MGIHGFSSYIRRFAAKSQYRVISNKAQVVSRLLLDLNGILHSSAVKVYGDPQDDSPVMKDKIFRIQNKMAESERSRQQLLEEHGKEITDEIERLSFEFGVQDVLYIALDGTPPDAKIKQQATRRYRKANQRDRSGEVHTQAFDSNLLTPGTEYMIKLDAYITNWVDLLSRRASKPPARGEYVLPPAVIYSGARVPGEGEHKIMTYLRSPEARKHQLGEEWTPEDDSSYDPDNPNYNLGHDVIYGMDSDILLLTLILPLPFLVVSQESKSERNLIRNDQKEYLYLMDNFRKAIYTAMTGENVEDDLMDLNDLDVMRVFMDYLVLVTFVGNDFLPGIPSFSDLEESLSVAMKIYQASFNSAEKGLTYPLFPEEGALTVPILDPLSKQLLPGPLVFDIHLRNFALFIGALAKEEPRMLEDLARKKKDYRSRRDFRNDFFTLRKATTIQGGLKEGDGVKVTLNYGKFRTDWYNKIFNTPQNRIMYESITLAGVDLSFNPSEEMYDMCVSYLTGLAWVCRYYQTGTYGINLRYLYEYHYSPLMTDLALSLVTMLKEKRSMRRYAPYYGPVTTEELLTEKGEKFTVTQAKVEGPASIFVHLLGTIPPSSALHAFPRFLPSTFTLDRTGGEIESHVLFRIRELMSPGSLIEDLFPISVKEDLENAHHEGDTVVLLPVFDRDRITQALEDITGYDEVLLEFLYGRVDSSGKFHTDYVPSDDDLFRPRFLKEKERFKERREKLQMVLGEVTDQTYYRRLEKEKRAFYKHHRLILETDMDFVRNFPALPQTEIDPILMKEVVIETSKGTKKETLKTYQGLTEPYWMTIPSINDFLRVEGQTFSIPLGMSLTDFLQETYYSHYAGDRKAFVPWADRPQIEAH